MPPAGPLQPTHGLMSPTGPLQPTLPGGDGLGDVPPLALAGVRSAPAPRLQLGCKGRRYDIEIILCLFTYRVSQKVSLASLKNDNY